jgi:flagellar biosynthetic protein FliO
MAEQIIAIIAVLALLLTVLWLLRQKGLARMNLAFGKRFGSSKYMEVVERLSLTPHHSLHLVRFDNRTVVVGVSPSGCTRIAVLRSSDPAGKLEGRHELG